MPQPPKLEDFLTFDTVRPERFKRKTTKDLQNVTIEQPGFVFPRRVVQQSEEFYEFHFNELFIAIQTLAGEVFSGSSPVHRYRRRSLWAHGYPDEFYEYVKSVAHPDSSAQHWEPLLRSSTERMMLVSGIIWKALDANVFSSLLFGASQDHEKILSAHDQDLLDTEGFSLSTLIAATNAAYLKRHRDHQPPQFWDRVGRITSQIVKMLLPLYNVCGSEFAERIPVLEDFVQATFNLVAYAGWLNVSVRQSSGVLNIIWSGPGNAAQADEKMILEDCYEDSQVCADHNDKQDGVIVRREKKVKISAAPAVVRLSLDKARPNHHKAYVIQQPHVVYYYGAQDGTDHMALVDYILAVRWAGERPSAWVMVFVFLLVCLIAKVWNEGQIRS